MFSHRGSSVSSRRRVPVPHLPEQEVSFVEQPDIDEAHVLLVCPHDASASRCYRLLLAHDSSRSEFRRIPEGWQLRPDIEARVVKPWPRNGDVYIPQLVGRLFQSGVVTTSLALGARSRSTLLLWFLAWTTGVSASEGSAAGVDPLPAANALEPLRHDAFPNACVGVIAMLATRHSLLAALLGWSHLLVMTNGMFAPPLEQQQLAPVPVGKFPWRLAPADRACHESVLPQNPARLLSPFTGLSDETIITPDSLVDEVRILLSSDEPFWYRDIVPLWPAIWQQTVVFVPLPPGGELVCVAVASPEWQMAVLLPRRADLEWVLAHLRRITPGSIASVRPPPAAQHFGQSNRWAVDWRSGDLLLAFQTGSESHVYEPPVFVSPEQVRHAAVWSYDFIVQCELPLLICRVGRQPSGTTMPPPTRWVAAEGAFTGRFRVKFPGRWVPVPWAYHNSITLCQRSGDPDHCNILLERCEGTALSFECHSVAAAATRYSLSQLANVPPDRITLLGQGVDSDDFPPLRDGDILHYTVSGATQCGGDRLPWRVMLVALCSFSSRGCILSALGILGSLADGWTAPGTFRDLPPLHGHPSCPFVSSLGVTSSSCPALRMPSRADSSHCSLQLWQPFPDTAEPWWNVSRRTMSDTLLCLACYLSAYGAPEWRKESDGWVIDLSSACRLQALLHRFWWGRALRESLPHSFPRSYHAAWGSLPLWAGGVPESILIATDGSGLHGGSWAFVVWGYFRGGWYRLGWDGMQMAATPWLRNLYDSIPAAQYSYSSELVALQAAAIWCCASLDVWQACMNARPLSVTIVVDNSSALQVAAGFGTTGGAVAANTRVLWQAVQGRVNTYFRHVHSHVGVMANTLADALASFRLPCPLVFGAVCADCASLADLLAQEGPMLWLIPRAHIRFGKPCIVFPAGKDECPETLSSECPKGPNPSGRDIAQTPAVSPQPQIGRPDPPPPRQLSVLTANVQTMKDAPCSIFNPSGHAARRQYLLHQATSIPCDVLCIQEARSRSGRWNTGGWLSWRSGHSKGQYGCEVWIRPEIVQPALTLESWRILTSTPRILVVTCIDSRLPLTVCSAHAPHAERPNSEAAGFWQELRTALLRAPSLKGVVVGLDANADFFAQDDDGSLIGSRLASGEPGRNDLYLHELCLQLGLSAPATQDCIQHGPGWSWEHTGGTRKRIDHILFQVGPWEVTSTGQALDFDLGHSVRDHMPLRARAVLRCPAPLRGRPQQRRWTPSEVVQHGEGIWRAVRAKLQHTSTPDQCVTALLCHYAERVSCLPRRPPLQPRQPYLSARTIQSLIDLRDWRQQLRCVARAHQVCCLQVCFRVWQGGTATPSDLAARRDSGRLWAVMISQERKLSRYVHDRARQDKAHHFLALTQSATDLWHSDGRPLESIRKLRWASRKAAERRAVYAAGGYDIDSQLEEQFRAQEGGKLTTSEQLRQDHTAWIAQDSLSCPSAVPSLLQIEHLCRRQQAAKAPGPDLVLNELWKAFPVYAGEWFWQICCQIALTGHEPFHFKLALICALYKKGPAALPQNYRSIALMNGMAKVWHSHLRSSLGQRILEGYDPLQLGGRRGIPVGFAGAAYRCAVELSHFAGRSVATLFVDVQAAYYEASRSLVFRGDSLGEVQEGLDTLHLAPLAQDLLASGALELLGVPEAERHLLQDCVAFSHWRLVSSERTYAATRGSRPGDGLADVIFGALFSIALQHIRRTCSQEQLEHQGTGDVIGCSNALLQLGWADDLAVLTDYAQPRELQARFPRVAEIVISTLQALKFRVNLGAGKTEAILDIRGNQAKCVRGELLSGSSSLPLGPEISLRLTPEYRYLGVVQTTRDTGRRDAELCAQRACGAWAHGRNLLASPHLPWALKLAWMSGRVLPAAYATLATSLAVSARAWSPLTGFYERAARTIVGSWQFGHVLTGPLLGAVIGLTTPLHAATLARVRLVVQLVTKAPADLLALFEAAWNRSTPWCEILADSMRAVAIALPDVDGLSSTSLLFARQQAARLVKVCRRLSRWGSLFRAVWDLWQDVVTPRQRNLVGEAQAMQCALCHVICPSRHALAAHLHRKHSVVNVLTKYTLGTVCLWCHSEHHSTDRLKYHLSRCRDCVHGLRVVIGHVYEYGTGTKRTGARQHRGLPPIRLPGPINATAAQRHAAAEGRPCSEEELSDELFQAVGTRDAFSWPDSLVDSASQIAAVPSPQRLLSAEAPSEHTPAVHAATCHPSRACRWFSLVDLSTVSSQDWHTPSPLWSGLLTGAFVCQFPSSWHQYWKLWKAMQVAHPWSSAAFDASALLRRLSEPSASLQHDERQPPSGLLDFLAATVAFRTVCAALQSRGAAWISGVPSAVGISLLRAVLPSASLYPLRVGGAQVFVIEHAFSSLVLRQELGQLFSPSPAASPRVLSLRTSFVYHTRSLG